jgi:hypothetical protein
MGSLISVNKMTNQRDIQKFNNRPPKSDVRGSETGDVILDAVI